MFERRVAEIARHRARWSWRRVGEGARLTTAGPRRRASAPAFDATRDLASLPNRPGVYRMLNAAGETIYVGKAGDLRKRVASYFQKTATTRATR